ncbi:MAG: hypothetical protein K8U57_28610 [Planctomycetes bacterium]|nr:hypothetical protein [Planctomycetota bacterium]
MATYPRIISPLVVVTLSAFIFLPGAASAEYLRRSRAYCTTVCPIEHCCAPSTIQVGSQPDDLKIRVSGDRSHRLEIYFRDEVRTVEFAGSGYLHCAGRIVTAPANEFGTFAVRTGEADDTIQFFAWRKGGDGAVTLVPSVPLTLERQHPLQVEWISTRTARVAFGNQQKTTIIRYHDVTTKWQQFDEMRQNWNELK